MIERIDRKRLAAARAIIDYVVPRVSAEGLFHPEDSLWAESGVYRSQHAGTLAVAGQLLDDDRCIEAARRMLYRTIDVRIHKLWSTDWWWDHPVSETVAADWKNWQEQNRVVEEGYASPTNLFNLGLYYRITGDDYVVEPSRESMAAMFARWDYTQDNWHHMTPEFAGLAVWAWEETFPQFASKKDPIVRRVIDRFVKDATNDFPFVLAVRMTLLLAVTGTRYLQSVLKPGIDALLAASARRYEQRPDDFRHSAVTSDHINIRANMAVAIMMKHYDLAAGEQVYTGTPLYASLSDWIDLMRAPGGSYYECQDIVTGRKYGQGSPAHYIPLWWILAARLP
ncbi:MAG: hypothetical protein MK110_09470 [Fuerstiella sp.]|nr:hypothetical protein [Fuerstiella sp.]